MELQKIKTATKIPEMVMQSLLLAMEDGTIEMGSELPPERELAVALGVGRNSLRECLAILEYMNVIETQANRKIVVKDAKYFQKAVAFIRTSHNTNVLLDSIEFRQGIEVMIAKLACERATEEDLALMKGALDRLDANIYDHDADIEFHNFLAQASHNVIYVANMDLLSSILMDVRLHYYKNAKYHERTLKSHHRIFQAVLNRNPEEAVCAIEEHLNIVIDFTKEAIESGELEE